MAIPESVNSAEGYNHIGDIAFEGGRVLLPLECYTFGGPNGGNTCGTGAIGSANPQTLAFDYYVKLDPAEIPKAMWVESHRGLLWTSSGPGPARLPRLGREPRERRAGRGADPLGAPAGRRGAAERDHGRRDPQRPPAPRRGSGLHLPGVVG